MGKKMQLSADSVLFHVLRESSCPGPSAINVQLDGRDAYSLAKGESGEIWLVPGQHHVRLWSPGTWTNWDFDEETHDYPPASHQDFVVRCASSWFKNDITLASRTWCDRFATLRALERGESIEALDKFAWEIVEGPLLVEPTGETFYVEDNSGSSVSSLRVHKVENEWTRTVIVGSDFTQTKGVALQIGVSLLALEAKLESAVTSRFSVKQGERRLIAQEVQVQVPAYSRLEVRVAWKMIWQTGVIRVTGRRKTIEIPFRFAHSQEFDRHTVSR
jgi:hypothetical protein